MNNPKQCATLSLVCVNCYCDLTSLGFPNDSSITALSSTCSPHPTGRGHVIRSFSHSHLSSDHTVNNCNSPAITIWVSTVRSSVLTYCLYLRVLGAAACVGHCCLFGHQPVVSRLLMCLHAGWCSSALPVVIEAVSLMG